MTDIAAGIVVAAPMATSVAPMVCRRPADSRLDTRRPTPTPSAARVTTTKPSVGRLSRTCFMVNSVALRARPVVWLAVHETPERRSRSVVPARHVHYCKPYTARLGPSQTTTADIKLSRLNNRIMRTGGREP
jgi:hypothetical protein